MVDLCRSGARGRAPRARDAGVTLIEMLVVLALIGASAGVVSYALPSAAPARNLDQDAALLASRLNLAAERSLMTGQVYRMDWQSDGYVFQAWRDGAWQSEPGTPLDAPHGLARGAVLSDDAGSRRGRLTITPDLLPADQSRPATAEDTEAATLWVTAGAQRRGVYFDGASAGVTP